MFKHTKTTIVVISRIRANTKVPIVQWHMQEINPLTDGAAYIQVFIFYRHIKYHILNMLKIKCDIDQQDLKRVDFDYVKSE